MSPLLSSVEGKAEEEGERERERGEGGGGSVVITRKNRPPTTSSVFERCLLTPTQVGRSVPHFEITYSTFSLIFTPPTSRSTTNVRGLNKTPAMLYFPSEMARTRRVEKNERPHFTQKFESALSSVFSSPSRYNGLKLFAALHYSYLIYRPHTNLNFVCCKSSSQDYPFEQGISWRRLRI